MSDSMTDLGKGLLHNGHASAGREDRLPQVISLILKWNINLTLSECLHQLFGNPLHRLGRDLGPKVTVKRGRCSSLSKESKCIIWMLFKHRTTCGWHLARCPYMLCIRFSIFSHFCFKDVTCTAQETGSDDGEMNTHKKPKTTFKPRATRTPTELLFYSHFRVCICWSC